MCHLAYSAVAQPGVEAKSRYPNRFELANRFQSICKPHSPCQKPSRLAERSRSHCEPRKLLGLFTRLPKGRKRVHFWEKHRKIRGSKKSSALVASSYFNRTCALMRSCMRREGNPFISKAALQKAENRNTAKTGLSLAHMSYRCDKILGIIEDRQQPAVNTIRRTHPVTGLTDITPGNAGNSQSHPKGKSPLSL
ncbi:hypothetical protein H4Q26_009328 [Puccinia striiformis f. sp. tritici PST-130]|uniref:Uncharacterized protein n=2 Tax=Puccinia striiformis TaxID=27350 RepID=A0A0L0V4S6_9BASI|nr:hypothetical protein H4Q26_009328 [Puccinia striiformis f. sp. tritici PST-130]KNE94287.1 hypothetical protein PSTG_12312 [Puccinia striiformis f. sp. tritici PST-78]POW09582.1 hypothetical protein PSTT_06767 [Puccinia striiformis]